MEKMQRRFFCVLYILVLLTLLLFPTNSWVYHDGPPSDSRFEKFGPRADKLLIRLYANETAEWDALASGKIDIADWPLSKSYYDLFTSNAMNPVTGVPYNDTINVVGYGSEPGLFILDLNNNNNTYLGNPPDPAYPNPVYPNPTSVKEMRQAIAYVVDRSQLDTIVGSEFYTPLYTVVPTYMGVYSHPEIIPGGLLENLTYPYSRANAEAKLDAGGFPVNSSTGWRFWDRNGDGTEQPDEHLELRFAIRDDDTYRLAFANFVADELNAVKVRVNRINLSGPRVMQVMAEKDFHLYTGGWSLSSNPDHLILWNWDYYWHPGFAYNYAGSNNETFNEASYGVLYAATQEEALTNAHLAQRVFAEQALSVPLWSSAGSKAMNRYYTGGNTWQPVTPDDGENKYRGRYWRGVVNRPVYGIDNFFSFLNMHPADYSRGNGENLTIRWGFNVPDIRRLNPVFAESSWDWNVLGLIYESLLMRNPYNIAEFIPWLAEDFEVGIYNHPAYGESTKVSFTLRADATWHDGTPITTADVYFSLVELTRILNARGYPDPRWGQTWIPGIGPWPPEPPIYFKILDPYNFEILFDERNIWLLSWSGIVILPKHIWKPIAETGPVTDFAPDPNMIGSGPWRFKEYVENSHVLLVADRPGSTVQTNLPDSTSLTSPKGYWRYYPVTLGLTIDGAKMAKNDYYYNNVQWVPPPPQPKHHTINFTVTNLYYGEPLTVDVHVKFTFPNGTVAEYTYLDIVLNATDQTGSSWTTSETMILKGRIRVNSDVYVKQPVELAGAYNYTCIIWSTIKEDISGSTLYDDLGFGTYPYKSELPSPDIRDDIKDIATIAKAFGSFPGHERWRMGIGDINGDYKVDIRDIAGIAKRFGWTG